MEITKEDIREYIYDQSCRSSRFLNEREIAERFSIKCGRARELLLKLVGQGVVKRRPRSGCSYVDYRRTSMDSILLLRFIAEKMSLFAFGVISALLIAGCCCKAAEVEVRESKTNFAAEAVKPYIDSGELPGIISIFYKDGVQETVCSGWADVEKKIPMSLDRMFMQCSQTKGFCGVTIAILLEEGKISLDDPVSKYLPEFKNLKVAVKDKNGKTIIVPAKNALTIRMVMNHTGGYPLEIPSKYKKGCTSCSLRDTAKEAAAQPLLFEPGTQVKYSNVGIDIGAAIVEVVTGQPWEVFLKERVFDKLGMKDATFNPTDEQLSRAMTLYQAKAGKKAWRSKPLYLFPPPYNGPTVFPSAGGGLWVTAVDQLKFYKMLMNLGVGDNGVRILKEETVKKYLAKSTRPDKLGNYSLGLIAQEKKGIMGHGGAFKTQASVNWKKKELIIKIVQLRAKNGNPWDKALRQAAKKFFSQKIDTSEVDAYTGRIE